MGDTLAEKPALSKGFQMFQYLTPDNQVVTLSARVDLRLADSPPLKPYKPQNPAKYPERDTGFTKKDLAAHFGVCVLTISNWIKSGKLPKPDGMIRRSKTSPSLCWSSIPQI